MDPRTIYAGSPIEPRTTRPFGLARRHAIVAGLVVAALLLASGPAHATDDADARPADDLMNLSLEQLLNTEISAASRFSQKASDAPSAVSVVTAQDIRIYGYRTFADILNSIRGLYVTNDRNYSYLGVRGFARPGDYNTRVLLLVDGYRVSDNVYDQAPIGTEFPIDVDLIERVEFIPGPGSSIYGSGAFLGVINVRTKNGSDFRPAEVKIEAASAETYRGRVTGGFGFENGGSLLLSASGMDSQGKDLYFPEFDSPATNNGVAQGLDYDQSHSFFAKYVSANWTVELVNAERTKGIPTASYGQEFNVPGAETVDQRTYASVGYTNAWSDHDISARLSVTQWSYDGSYMFAVPTKDGADGLWWDAEFQFGTRTIQNHHIIFGADLHVDDKQDQFAYEENPRVDYLDDKRSGHRYGLYAQDEIALGDRWLLNAGVRFDDYYSDDETTLNPRIAAIFKARDTTTLKFLYGTAFRSPNAYERYYVSPGYKTNPDIEPETIKTYEFVVEERRPQGLRLSGSVFHYSIKDLISLATDPNDGLLVFANVDRVETNGAEFEMERIWDSGTRLRASVTWQRAEDATTGERLTNSPSLLGNVNFTMPVFHGWAEAGIEGQYVGNRLTLDGNHADGYGLVNLTLVSRKLVRNVELSASVYNLFDKDYGVPGSEEHAQDILWQDGRTWRLSGTYRF